MYNNVFHYRLRKPCLIFFSIYDIFGTSPDTTEVDEKESWVEKCHGCLRLFFCFFLFIFVLGTALLSRLTFHIILINLNPPTIFTTMNKFDGDSGNTTAPFLPAQVHISWIWACFFVLVAPSLHSCVYHSGQLCRKRDLKVVDADEKKHRMIFRTLSPTAAKVSPITTNGDSQVNRFLKLKFTWILRRKNYFEVNVTVVRINILSMLNIDYVMFVPIFNIDLIMGW